MFFTLRWRHNWRDSVSNQQPHDCLLNHLFRRRSKKTLKLRVSGLCAGNSPGTGEFPAQMASNAENVSIWWRHHEYVIFPHPKLNIPMPTRQNYTFASKARNLLFSNISRHGVNSHICCFVISYFSWECLGCIYIYIEREITSENCSSYPWQRCSSLFSW